MNRPNYLQRAVFASARFVWLSPTEVPTPHSLCPQHIVYVSSRASAAALPVLSHVLSQDANGGLGRMAAFPEVPAITHRCCQGLGARRPPQRWMIVVMDVDDYDA